MSSAGEHLAKIRTWGQKLDDITSPMKLNVLPPQMITGNNTVVVPFQNNDGRSAIRIIKNVSAEPVYVAINTDPSATIFHDVLKSATDKTSGDGGVFDASSFEGEIRIFGAAAYEVCTIEAEEHRP